MVPPHDTPSISRRSSTWRLGKGISEDMNALSVPYVDPQRPCLPFTY